MSRARDFQEQRRRSKTLFHHGFFGKYTIPKDRERRRSKRNPAGVFSYDALVKVCEASPS